MLLSISIVQRKVDMIDSNIEINGAAVCLVIGNIKGVHYTTNTTDIH